MSVGGTCPGCRAVIQRGDQVSKSDGGLTWHRPCRSAFLEGRACGAGDELHEKDVHHLRRGIVLLDALETLMRTSSYSGDDIYSIQRTKQLVRRMLP